MDSTRRTIDAVVSFWQLSAYCHPRAQEGTGDVWAPSHQDKSSEKRSRSAELRDKSDYQIVNPVCRPRPSRVPIREVEDPARYHQIHRGGRDPIPCGIEAGKHQFRRQPAGLPVLAGNAYELERQVSNRSLPHEPYEEARIVLQAAYQLTLPGVVQRVQRGDLEPSMFHHPANHAARYGAIVNWEDCVDPMRIRLPYVPTKLTSCRIERENLLASSQRNIAFECHPKGGLGLCALQVHQGWCRSNRVDQSR